MKHKDLINKISMVLNENKMINDQLSNKFDKFDKKYLSYPVNLKILNSYRTLKPNLSVVTDKINYENEKKGNK